MFVRWECGCVGLFHNDKPVVIKSCQGDERDFPMNALHWVESESMGDKTWVPLTSEEADAFAKRIDHRLGMADRFERIKWALRDAVGMAI